eukprot:TRINITY_DN63919_c0_g1_i1.p1 TRINITY_DN63919_c0_g1~~TRINITY_DN63919_c0_g1_i1.p1  ORF type:complete len:719 (-),score=43.31 TRINITY_DN63919_c0_g1_i1:79-2181(-)
MYSLTLVAVLVFGRVCIGQCSSPLTDAGLRLGPLTVGHTVALRSVATGRLVEISEAFTVGTAWMSDDGVTMGNESAQAQFHVISLGNGNLALRNIATDRFVEVYTEKGNVGVFCSARSADDFEFCKEPALAFTVLDAGESHVVLLSRSVINSFSYNALEVDSEGHVFTSEWRPPCNNVSAKLFKVIDRGPITEVVPGIEQLRNKGTTEPPKSKSLISYCEKGFGLNVAELVADDEYACSAEWHTHEGFFDDGYNTRHVVPESFLDTLHDLVALAAGRRTLPDEWEQYRLEIDAYLASSSLLNGWTDPKAYAISFQTRARQFLNCPILFVAIELYLAFQPWFSGAVSESYDLVKTMSEQQQLHRAHALQLIKRWQSLVSTNADEQLAVRRQNMCSSLVSRWHLFGLLTTLARCESPGASSDLSIADLFGCRGHVGVDDRCHGDSVERFVGTAVPTANVFFSTLYSALVHHPRIDHVFDGSAFADTVSYAVRERECNKKVGCSSSSGLFLEFGVHMGESINEMGRTVQAQAQALGASVPRIYGFDSFQGLPTAWSWGGGKHYDASSFTMCGFLPAVETNVRLVKGWINDTLPIFLDGVRAGSCGGSKPWVRLVHIDTDLYQSARDVLFLLEPFFRVGTIIIFDQLVNYPEFMSGEFLALYDWLRSYPRSFRVLYAPWIVAKSRDELVRRRFGRKDVAIELFE